MSHLLNYLEIEIEEPQVPVLQVPPPKPVIQRNGKVVGEFVRWYRSQGNTWGAIKRGFEGDVIDVAALSEEGKRLAGILASCNTEQRRKLRGYVRSVVGGVFEGGVPR